MAHQPALSSFRVDQHWGRAEDAFNEVSMPMLHALPLRPDRPGGTSSRQPVAYELSTECSMARLQLRIGEVILITCPSLALIKRLTSSSGCNNIIC
jgi:hypothetical protein